VGRGLADGFGEFLEPAAEELLRANLRRVRGLRGDDSDNFQLETNRKVVEQMDKVTRTLMLGSGWSDLVRIPGQPVEAREVQFLAVSPGFFHTMGMRLVAGRDMSVSFHSLWVRKDGRKTRIAWTARLVENGQRPGFIVATGAEMTRGRKLVRELEEAESRFATIFELLPDPVVVHQDGRLIYVNRAGLRMYGATCSADIVGLPVSDRLAPESKALVRDRLTRLMSGEPVPMIEERHLTMGGRPFDVEVVAAPISIGGRPAVVLAARDITERKATAAAGFAQATLANLRSRQRLAGILDGFDAADLDHMAVDGDIVMTCEFCNHDFRFPRAGVRGTEV